jgi:hypothetical protein
VSPLKIKIPSENMREKLSILYLSPHNRSKNKIWVLLFYICHKVLRETLDKRTETNKFPLELGYIASAKLIWLVCKKWSQRELSLCDIYRVTVGTDRRILKNSASNIVELKILKMSFIQKDKKAEDWNRGCSDKYMSNTRSNCAGRA